MLSKKLLIGIAVIMIFVRADVFFASHESAAPKLASQKLFQGKQEEDKPGAEDSDGSNLSVSEEMPFGLSNPYDQKDDTAVKSLPEILHDLGLSKDKNGAGFVVDIIGRKKVEVKCDDAECQYDFSQAKELIDLVVGQGEAHLWIVIGSPSNYKFIDGKERKNEKTYLPDGLVSRQAYKDYLIALVNFVNSYGKKVSGNPDWHVVRWNLYNEVNAEYKSTFDEDIDRATTAYVNFVIDSAEVLRNLSSQSKIVLAGAGSSTDLEGKHGEFYRLVFSKLKQSKLAYEPFDYWESHWFGEVDDYAKNKAGYEAKDFINFLKNNGYGDKEFLIRAGATYSGQDSRERKHLMDNYQSEREQAEFLIKRFIYNLANGVKKIPWSTVYEHKKYQGDLHVHFNNVGLIYNGVPNGVSKKEKCVKGWSPCPDPGYGIKKLSYYAYKKLIETLRGSDWDDVWKIQESSGIHIYKFTKSGKPIWVAWNDNPGSQGTTISGISSTQVKITGAVPKYESGKEVADYNAAFNAETKFSTSGKVSLIISGEPVFVEEK